MKYLGFIVTSQNFIHMQSAAYVYCLVTICIDTFEVIYKWLVKYIFGKQAIFQSKKMEILYAICTLLSLNCTKLCFMEPNTVLQLVNLYT